VRRISNCYFFDQINLGFCMNSEQTPGCFFFLCWVFTQVNYILFLLKKFIFLFLNKPFPKGFQGSCIAMGVYCHTAVLSLEFSLRLSKKPIGKTK